MSRTVKWICDPSADHRARAWRGGPIQQQFRCSTIGVAARPNQLMHRPCYSRECRRKLPAVRGACDGSVADSSLLASEVTRSVPACRARPREPAGTS